MADKSGKIDRGFAFNYWRLSYRRKFTRTLWCGALSLLILAMPPEWGVLGLTRNEVVVVLLVISAAQAFYTYAKWQSEEKQ